MATITLTRSPGVRIIGSVATDPAMRGRGYAGAILKQILHEHYGEQIAVFAIKDAVAGFYRQFGFEQIGRWGRLRK